MRSAIRTGRPPAPVHRARCSISFVFFVNGFLLASWLPHIPEVKERLALNDLQLGIALLAMAAGVVLALPFGRLAHRYARQPSGNESGAPGALPVLAGAGAGTDVADPDAGVAAARRRQRDAGMLPGPAIRADRVIAMGGNRT